MTDHKFTDEEVMQALRCCGELDSHMCENCPLRFFEDGTACIPAMSRASAELIIRQKKEIERLQKLLDDKCDRCIARDRAEGIKEFADKLIHEVVRNHNVFVQVADVVRYVKQISEKMEEGKKDG